MWVRGHENVRKRVLIQAAACNLALLLRRRTGTGTPRSLQGRAPSAIFRWIECLIDPWGRLSPICGLPWPPTALIGPIAHPQATWLLEASTSLDESTAPRLGVSGLLRPVLLSVDE